jgi:dynein heavy chain
VHLARRAGLAQTLIKASATLDKIQNSLDEYLEKKKMAFPRFYFLSNDELLEILSQTKDPKAVQPHMGKCFDGIKRLDFGGTDPAKPETADFRIYGIVSPEAEVVDYVKKMGARGNVEAWLTAVENEMRGSLREYMKAAVLAYPTKPREEWIDDHLCQVVLTVAPLYWCRQVLAAFDADEKVEAMKENWEREKRQLYELTQVPPRRTPLCKTVTQ